MSRKHLSCAAAAALLGVAAAASHAALNVDRNGVLWPGTFEGDVADLTTSIPPWGIFDRNGFAAESSDGNIYRYVSGSVGTAVSYEQTATFAGAPGQAWTAEARVRVEPSAFEAGDGAGALIMGVNSQAYAMRFHTGFVTYNFSSGLSTVATLDTTLFHTYRMVVDQSANPAFSLYIDGNPTPVLTTNDTWFTSPGFNKLVFGDTSTGGLAGIMEVDYISWTAGAFPVPEPTGLLAAAAGFGLLGLRRRR